MLSKQVWGNNGFDVLALAMKQEIDNTKDADKTDKSISLVDNWFQGE